MSATNFPPATAAEQACVEKLKEAFPLSILPDEDAHFLDGNTYLRFARARDGKLDKASEMLQAALDWRKEYKPYNITGEDVRQVMEQLTMACGGQCHKGYPVLLMTLGVANTCSAEERIKQFVYILETTQRKGYDCITWIVNFGEMGKNKTKDPETATTRKETMKILQDYYPERLGAMLLYCTPWYVRMLITFVRPFLDARTRSKIHKSGSALKDLEKYIDASQIPAAIGGGFSEANLTALAGLPNVGDVAENMVGEAAHEEASPSDQPMNELQSEPSTSAAEAA